MGFISLHIMLYAQNGHTHTHTRVPQLGTGTATVKFFFLPAWHFLCRFSDTLFECWVWKSRLKQCLPRPLIFGNMQLKTSSFLRSATSLKNKIVSRMCVDFYKILNSVKTGWRRRKLTELSFTCKLVKKKRRRRRAMQSNSWQQFPSNWQGFTRPAPRPRGVFPAKPRPPVAHLIFFFLCVSSHRYDLCGCRTHTISPPSRSQWRAEERLMRQPGEQNQAGGWERRHLCMRVLFVCFCLSELIKGKWEC